MNPARKRIQELLYGPESPITRNLHEALDRIGNEWQADKDELTRLRKAIEDAPDCSALTGWSTYFRLKYEDWKSKALEGGE